MLNGEYFISHFNILFKIIYTGSIIVLVLQLGQKSKNLFVLIKHFKQNTWLQLVVIGLIQLSKQILHKSSVLYCKLLGILIINYVNNHLNYYSFL